LDFGTKSEWFDRRLRANIALFYNFYHNLQLDEFYFTHDQSGNLIQGNTILNAAQAHTDGVELEFTAVPVEGLTLNLSAAYLDARYTKFLYANPDTGKTDDLAGRALQNAPPWSGTAGFTYLRPVGHGIASLSVQYRYTAALYNYGLTDPITAKIQATSYVDGTLGWKPDGASWSIEVWARNIANHLYLASVFESPGFLGTGSYAPPREFGATLKYHW
jgi:iron complex outermembrane receptor protein